MKIRSLLLAILSFQSILAQTTQIPEEITQHVKARVEEGFNPGISIAYIEDGEPVFFNYGKTEKNTGNLVDEHSVYEIGSISKVFTTILLADEVLKERMKLSDPVSKYLPKTVKMPSKDDKEITLMDLATHSSALPGMPDNFDPADYSNPFADYTVKQLYEFLSSYELTRPIGTQYEYSNLGMGLLGHILELHTGMDYEALIKSRITKPLGMNATGIVFTDDMKSHLARGHNESGEVVSNWDIRTLAGAGAIRSTTADMIKFIKANINATDTDLGKAMLMSHDLVFTDTNLGVEMGLGWHFADNSTIIWHNGGTGGYKAFAGFVRGKNRGVVVLTNSTSSVDMVGLKLLGAPVGLELPKKRVFPEVVEVSVETLQSYVGNYELAPDFILSITRKGNQLFAQATGQPQFEVYASAQNEFFLRVVEASVTFNKNASGAVDSLTLHQNGQDIPARKME